MARIYADHLVAKKTTILYNHDDDVSILLKEPIKKTICGIPYKLPTLANLGTFANHFKNIYPLFVLLKFFNLLIRYPYWLFSCLFFLFKFIRLKPTNFIINNGSYPGGEWCRSATIAAKIYSILFSNTNKIIHIVHNEPTKPFFILFAPIDFFIDYLIDKSSKLICVSQQNADKLKEIRHIKQEVDVIYNGIQKQNCKKYLSLENRPLKLLNVASLDKRKNQLLILQTLNLLKQHEIELHLVGKESEDGYLQMLQEYAKNYNLNVFFHGFCNPKPFYKECDIFILSSLREGFPLVTLEAMSYGTPIITTKCGGAIEQVVNNHNGIMIDTNIQDLSRSIEFFIHNPQEIEKMGKNAHTYVQKKFSFETMLSQYQKVCFK